MRVVRLDASFAAGALGADAILSGTLIPASDSNYRLLSVKCLAVWADIAAVIDGGAAFGVAFGDYTDTEIFECVTATGSISRGDKIVLEKANRWVRLIGTFPSSPSAAPDGEVVFNDGRPRKTRLNWAIPIGKTVKFFIWNQSDTLWSAGSTLVMTGSAAVAYS